MTSIKTAAANLLDAEALLNPTSTTRDGKKEVVDSYTDYHEKKKSTLANNEDPNKLGIYVQSTKYFYDLVTDFYEFGWGQSFHFAPRHFDESFEASIARHEYFLALRLGLKKGMRVLDVGCGVGGPLRNIARFSKSHVVGVNYNDYQIQRAKKLTRDPTLNSYVQGDFNKLSEIFEPESFDAVYQMEATCHCLKKTKVYGEIYKVLKPGGDFASMEWVLTAKYDANNPEHVKVKDAVCQGNGIDDLVSYKTVLEALAEVGFQVWDQEDVGADSDISWWDSLAGTYSIKGFKRTFVGRAITNRVLGVLEYFKVVPGGTTAVSNFLNSGADALVRAGQLGIITPCFFTVAKKPLKK